MRADLAAASQTKLFKPKEAYRMAVAAVSTSAHRDNWQKSRRRPGRLLLAQSQTDD
jgi:hypothetical protein